MDADQQDDVLNVNEGTRIINGSTNANGTEVVLNRSGAVINHQDVKHVYRQDVVKRNDVDMIGVVTEVAGDSYSESEITDDEDDDDSNEDEDDDDGDYKEEEDEEMEEDTAEEDEDDEENETGDDAKNIDATKSIDESKNDGIHKGDPLSADQVRVLWMDGSETTNYLNDLTVVDRGFLHGDYVASDLDPTGQVGLVVDVNLLVDLLAPDGSIMRNVSSRDLKRVRDVTVGDYVVFGPWLGRVDDVLDNVTVLFDDGSVCKVMRAEPLRLRPISKNLLEDGHCPYYPGQRVRASSSSVFKNSRFLSGTWKANRVEGTIKKVAVGSVYVHWIASAGYGPESSTTPAEEQNPKNLKLLSCFTHANWQVGDWCLPPSSAVSTSTPLEKGLSKLQLQGESATTQSEHDLEDAMPEEPNDDQDNMDFDGTSMAQGADKIVSPKSSSCGSSLSVSKECCAHGTWSIHRKKLRKVVVKRDKKSFKKDENFEKALLIMGTRTMVDVAWQDGKIEQRVSSTSLIPVESPGDHDFVAEQYVVEKGADDTDDFSEIRRVGVVKSVNAKEKTACIRWLKPVARPEDLREFDKEEIVSVYELEGHPDYDYCYGDVVVRLSPVTVPGETAHSGSVEEKWQPSGSDGVKSYVKKHPSQSEVNGAFSEEVPVEFSDLSWVGNITGLRNGDIEVTWADGMVSTVGPQAVYVVGRDDDDASIAGGSEMDDAASWETVEDDEVAALEIDEKELESSTCTCTNLDAGEGVVVGENTARNGPLSFPLAAFGFVTRLATGIFSLGRKQADSTGSEFIGEEVHLQGELNISDGRAYSNGSCSQDSTISYSASGQINDAKGMEIDDAESSKLLDAAEILCSLGTPEANVVPYHGGKAYAFKRFDTAKDPVDHFFLTANAPSNSSRKWLKKVQQDWNILQSNLPEGIFVRVYEDRMDLLRAVIVGAYGTPYQDGLFFFDFHLPTEFPDVPPSAHYHSGGWRINPNLYEEGKVCLSLLNTWTGRGNEVWDPKSSSILQVLVSLQGLVLNSKPYFNEAGYDKQVGTAEGEKNSLSYNENTFLLNCKTMMYLIRKPPKDFEDLVKDHFKKHGNYILKACDAYMKGYLIGSLSRDASVTDNSEANATSVGFKLMLAKIVPKLYLALSELGADCHEFKHLQEL